MKSRRPAFAAKTGGSQPVAEAPSAGEAPPSPDVPAASHPAVLIRALAPTVAGWMPAEGPRAPDPSLPVRPDPPVSMVVERTVDESLAAVGLKPGDVVDRTYRIDRTLGVGGMGVVALAYDERLDRRVAIKLIKPELFAFPEMRSYFDNEARAMARVSHPNVIHV